MCFLIYANRTLVTSLLRNISFFRNQANTQTWIYLLKPNIEPKLLFNSYEAPFYPLNSTCNNMPDFMTSGRYSLGEHHIVYYRYNGQQYEVAYSYM